MRWLWSLLLLPFSSLSFQMRCSNLYGLETQLYNTDCSWVQPAGFYIDELGRRGFNWLRIPFSAGYIEREDFSILDNIFNSASKWNMSILLDWHRNRNVGWQGDWLDDLSRDDYLRLYTILLSRYEHNPVLKMASTFNEYKGMDSGFWKKEMEGIVSSLESRFPDRFSWVIGCPQWSGNCHDMDWSHLNFSDRVYIDIHKYQWSHVIDQGYEQDWEYSFPKNKTNVILGEWGWKSELPEQVAWASQFVQWLSKNNISKSCFWVSVTNSGDTNGLWKECRDFEETKYQLLQQFWNNTFLSTLPRQTYLRK